MPVGFTFETIGRTFLIRFDRPERRNPLSVSVVESLSGFLENLESSNAADHIIFTGTETVFASGADLKEISALSVETAPEFAERGQKLMRLVASDQFCSIAAINGYCLGGALDLALSCTRRFASPNAKFAHPGAGLGIITGWGGTQRLPRLIGTVSALELLFTAEPIDAKRAIEIGLIDKIADDPVSTALDFINARAE